MKQYTHAWLAFMAIQRLEQVDMEPQNRNCANTLIKWFKAHRDGVIQGSWYPDSIIKDMASSHVLKFTPAPTGVNEFGKLPGGSLLYRAGKTSALYKKPCTVEKNNNLPDRCDALSHSVIDNLKMQESEEKGSPISPTDNHVATILFMLSHYIADAHVPFHCDSRSFSSGCDLHGHVEGKWDEEIRNYYPIDTPNQRFFSNQEGYPLFQPTPEYQSSYLREVAEELSGRPFEVGYGANNNNVRDYMTAVCHFSYLASHAFIPSEYDETTVTLLNWRSLPGQTIDFHRLSIIVLADAVDSIAKVWFRVWRRYMEWLN